MEKLEEDWYVCYLLHEVTVRYSKGVWFLCLWKPSAHDLSLLDTSNQFIQNHSNQTVTCWSLVSPQQTNPDLAEAPKKVGFFHPAVATAGAPRRPGARRARGEPPPRGGGAAPPPGAAQPRRCGSAGAAAEHVVWLRCLGKWMVIMIIWYLWYLWCLIFQCKHVRDLKESCSLVVTDVRDEGLWLEEWHR